MWDEIDAYVNKYSMLEHTDRIVLGLSGGADSICLARYLLYRRELGGPGLVAVHINHMLRGTEARRDEAFVQTFCRRWDIPLYHFRKDVKKVSLEDKMTLEEAGRKVRYECFRNVMYHKLAGKKVRLAVAHHADDLAETMIFRMVRGTGPKGLVAVRPVQGDIIRPFLSIRKKKILSLLHIMEQDYVEDATNSNTEFSRNFIRHRILADMEQLNPLAVEHLCNLSSQQDELLSYVEPEIERLCGTVIKSFPYGFGVEVEEILDLPDHVRRELLKRLLFMAAGRDKDIGSVHIDQLLSLLQKEPGKQNSFPYGLVAVREGTGLILSKKEVRQRKEEEARKKTGKICVEIPLPEYADGSSWSVPVDGRTLLHLKYEDYRGQQIIKKDCEKYFDYDKIRYQLHIRTRREGDYFVFDDLGRHKRLSRYFIDKGIAKDERDRRLLLAENSHIIWILGYRISREYRVTPKTGRMLEISYTVQDRPQQDLD